MTRVIVCGGRDYGVIMSDANQMEEQYALGQRDFLERFLSALHSDLRFGPITRLAQGWQYGADQFGRRWGVNAGLAVVDYRADWGRYGNRAGPIRNTRMLKGEEPDFVVAFPGGKGTANMIKQANSYFVPVIDATEKTMSTLFGPSAPNTIPYFTGRYRFLSNFYPVTIDYECVTYPTVEHAYQAAKSDSPEFRLLVALMPSPGEAKRAGRRTKLRRDWDSMKLEVMENLLRRKFNQTVFRRALATTKPAILIEGNSWGDKFWGQCPLGEGENNLGRLLMKIRDEL